MSSTGLSMYTRSILPLIQLFLFVLTELKGGCHLPLTIPQRVGHSHWHYSVAQYYSIQGHSVHLMGELSLLGGLYNKD